MARLPIPVRRWWINSARHWFRGGQILCAHPIRESITLLVHYSILLDWDSCDITLWLGWVGFRLWWQIEDYTLGFHGDLSSGIALMHGRVTPIEEGGRYCRHISTHMMQHADQLLQQRTINGQIYISDFRGRFSL